MVNELLDQKPLMIRSAVRLKRRKEKESDSAKLKIQVAVVRFLKQARRDLALSRGDFLSIARPSIGDGMV